jgi:4-aminobutyrate aminotransferase-like enzyme
MKKHKLIGDVRGKGLMIGLELVKNKDKTPAFEEASQISEICRENGLLIGVGGVYGNVIRIQPPLVIDENQLEKALGVLDYAFSTVEK